MFDQGPINAQVKAGGAGASAVNSETVRDPQAIKAINDTITNLRNNPDQVADYANNLKLNLAKQVSAESSVGQSNALGKVSSTIDDVKEQTLGIGRDVPLESIDLNHADNRHYAHQMAEQLIQELTFLLPTLERENRVDLSETTFSPKDITVGHKEAQLDSLAQKKEQGLASDLELLLGESVKKGLELPLRESLANATKKAQRQELGNQHELNQEEHLGLRSAEELDRLQALPTLEEKDPLEIVNSVVESLVLEKGAEVAEKFDTKVRTLTSDTGDSSSNVRSSLAKELNPFSWDTAA